MHIHVVLPGETIELISKYYGISVERLIQDNELSNPYNLVAGQTIVIVYSNVTYTVKEGDTLESIADAFQVSQIQILQNNPTLATENYLIIGETLVIENDVVKKRKISTNGYAYPFIHETDLRMALPFLTYLTVFSYRLTAEGDIIPIDDAKILQLAKDYGAAPIMLLTTFTGTEEEGIETAHFLLDNPQILDQIINRVIPILKEKGYYGINIDSQDVRFEERKLYVEFVTRFTKLLKEAGFIVFVTFTPNTFEDAVGVVYRGPEYAEIGSVVDKVLLLSYEWGRNIRSPYELPSISLVKEYLDYIKGEIPIEKVSIGIPCIGYEWELPYIKGESMTLRLSYNSAINLAVEVGTQIQYNEDLQSPFYKYEISHRNSLMEHIVYFKDARSIEALTNLVPEYGLDGIGIWNIMIYFAQMWLVINNQYEIDKIL